MAGIPDLPGGFKLDQPPPPPGFKIDAPEPPVNTNAVALGGADMDEHFSQGTPGYLLDKFGQGVKDGWGAKPLGLDPETDAWLKKYAPDYGLVGRAFHDAVVRPAAAALDFALNRAPNALYHGIGDIAVDIGVPRDIVAFAEAFPAGHLTGFPAAVPVPAEIERAADLGVIGKGEAGYQDLPTAEAVKALSPTGKPTATEAVARPVSRETPAAAPGAAGTESATEAAAQPVAAPAAPDIHSIARDIAPDTFSEYDALSARRDTFRRWLGELSDTRANSDQAQALQGRIDDILGKVGGVEDRLTKAAGQRLQAAREQLDGFLRSDTPDMARVRQDLQKTDFAMRDLAPDVSAAYRKAVEQVPPVEEAAAAATPPAAETAAEAVQPTEAAQAPETAPKPETPAPAATEAAPATPEPAPQPATAAEPIPGGISGDVAKQLVAAGRPAEEADAAAALVQAHYEARAERFDGAKGTAEDLYRADAPAVRAGRGVKPAEAATPSGVKFTTAKGSVYDVHEDGTTTRNKSFHPEHGAADQGLQPRSEATFYVSPEDAQKLGEIQSIGGPSRIIAPLGDGRWGVKYLDGKDAGKFERRTVVSPVSDRPAAGLTPVEIFNGGKRVHFGNEITKLEGQTAEPALEPAQGTKTRRGKIRLATDDAKATITLFKDADSSTFIHETGHHWLEELMSDAADSRAPADLTSDAATVRQWLGVDDGAEIPTRAHEKFARGFERYMMEGHAPSAKLADVFAKFRDWLTKIYETVAGLRSPINDDIRGVFDRMLATKGEEPVIAPERPTGTFADIHEADAEHTPPPQASEVAALVRTERDKIGEAAHPEIQDERVGARAPAEDAGSAGGGGVSGQGEPARGDNAGAAGRISEPGAVGEGGSKAAAEGNRASERQRNPNPTTEQPAGPHAEFGPADDGLVDKAGNIRLDNLNQPDDIDAVIREAADRNGAFTGERRGVISDGQMLDLADAIGKDPAFLNAKKIGDAFSGEEILAARKLLVQSATAVRDAMLKAAAGGDAEIAALAQSIARHEMIQGKVAQATAEWGRAGRAFRALDGWEQARDLNQFLKQNTGRDLNQLRQMAQLGKSLQTPGQVSKFVSDTAGGKVRQAIIYYWVNTLISGPITHLTYSVGNAVNALWTPLVETPLAATSGAVREALGIAGSDRVHFEEVSAQLYGLGKGFREALPTMVQAFKTGVSPLLPGERVPARMLDASLTQPIPGKIGYAIGLPGRAVSAIHSFFKTVRYEQSIQALAMRDALSQGLEGNARDLHVAKLTANPTPEIMEAAVGDTLKELYMRPQPYNSPGAALTRATNSWLPLKIVAPFVKIGSEIVRNAFVERTPLGLGSAEVRGNLAMREGGAAFDQQLGKVMAGTGLLAATVLGVLEGNVTGDGPSDPNERRVWLLNHQPNSISVGPITFSYARLGHLAMLTRFAANMTETAGRWNDNDGPQLARAFFDGITRSVLDETWMRGVKDFFDAIYHSEEHFDRWLTGFVAQWTPFSIGLGQIARKVDPYQRETRDLSTASEIFNQFKAHTPWLSETLPPRRDLFGEPITTGSGTVDRYANDRVAQAMDALHIGIATPQRKIRGVQLTPQQYDDYSRIGGRLAKMQLDALVGPAFKTLPMETQIKLIKETVTHSRESAAAQVMMQSVGSANDIIRQATDAKAAALHGAKPVEVKELLKAH